MCHNLIKTVFKLSYFWWERFFYFIFFRQIWTSWGIEYPTLARDTIYRFTYCFPATIKQLKNCAQGESIQKFDLCNIKPFFLHFTFSIDWKYFFDFFLEGREKKTLKIVLNMNAIYCTVGHKIRYLKLKYYQKSPPFFKDISLL